jgi:hypothetical protein
VPVHRRRRRRRRRRRSELSVFASEAHQVSKVLYHSLYMSVLASLYVGVGVSSTPM